MCKELLNQQKFPPHLPSALLRTREALEGGGRGEGGGLKGGVGVGLGDQLAGCGTTQLWVARWSLLMHVPACRRRWLNRMWKHKMWQHKIWNHFMGPTVARVGKDEGTVTCHFLSLW